MTKFSNQYFWRISGRKKCVSAVGIYTNDASRTTIEQEEEQRQQLTYFSHKTSCYVLYDKEKKAKGERKKECWKFFLYSRLSNVNFPETSVRLEGFHL